MDQGRDLYNAAAVCAGGAVVGVAHKQLLPNYGVFDERRTFASGGPLGTLYEVAGVPVGVTICEDAWSPTGPIAEAASGGAEVVVNLNASPYHRGKVAERERLIATRAADASTAIVYVNLVGGQDELVFDGGSFVVDNTGRLVARAAQFAPEVAVVDLDVRPVYRKRLLDPRERATGQLLPLVPLSATPAATGPPQPASTAPLLDPVEEVYTALAHRPPRLRHARTASATWWWASRAASTRRWWRRWRPTRSGPERVHGVLMPSRYSSEHSVDDARALADKLGIDGRVLPIAAVHEAFEAVLQPHFGELPPGLAEENLQSRIRGVLLMALSNKLGWLVLTTSNKSESAVGYATLYGDTAGGFSVLKDVPKLLVYDLCRWRNGRPGGPVIPPNVLVKPPSAELRPDQRDDQSLPPYEVLDPILEAYVEDDRSRAEIVAMGYDAEAVERVVRLVDLAEYKRRQTAPGVRISTKAFGKDRRLPITNRYRG